MLFTVASALAAVFQAFGRAAEARAVTPISDDDETETGAGGAGVQVGVYGPVGQGAFLAEMGIAQRLEVLLDAASTEEQQDALLSACERLVSEDGDSMGVTYQAMAIVGNKTSGSEAAGPSQNPPGFIYS